jgi:hypothetical protein
MEEYEPRISFVPHLNSENVFLTVNIGSTSYSEEE